MDAKSTAAISGPLPDFLIPSNGPGHLSLTSEERLAQVFGVKDTSNNNSKVAQHLHAAESITLIHKNTTALATSTPHVSLNTTAPSSQTEKTREETKDVVIDVIDDAKAKDENRNAGVDRLAGMEKDLKVMQLKFQDLENKLDGFMTIHQEMGRRYSKLMAHCRRFEGIKGLREGLRSENFGGVSFVPGEGRQYLGDGGKLTSASASSMTMSFSESSDPSSPSTCKISSTTGSQHSVVSIHSSNLSSNSQSQSSSPRYSGMRPMLPRSHIRPRISSDQPKSDKPLQHASFESRSSSSPANQSQDNQQPNPTSTDHRHSQALNLKTNTQTQRGPRTKRLSQMSFLSNLSTEMGEITYNAFPQFPSLNVKSRKVPTKNKTAKPDGKTHLPRNKSAPELSIHV